MKETTDAADTAPTACRRVWRLRPADQTTVNAPLTATCYAKQVQTSFDFSTSDTSGRILLSVHLMLTSEQQISPNSTLENLKL